MPPMSANSAPVDRPPSGQPSPKTKSLVDESEWLDEDGAKPDTSDSMSSEDDDLDDEPSNNNDKGRAVDEVANVFLDQMIVRLMSARPAPSPLVPSSDDEDDESSASAKNAKTNDGGGGEATTNRNGERPPSTTLNRLPIPVDVSFEEIKQLCDLACDSFRQQKSLLYLDKSHLPVVVCGDIHGQFQNLREIFFRCGSPHHQSYLFLGDYVDRGAQGIPTVVLLLALKVKYPTKVFLLRGNHESSQTNLSYGFYDECQERFIDAEENVGEAVWRKFVDVFNHMPFAAVIDRSIFCVHGGLSPSLQSLEDIEKIERPCIVPPFGLACDLLWSDPKVAPGRDGWSMSIRGMSFAFTPSVVDEFCERLGIDLFVRGHQMLNTAQMMHNGFEFFSGGRLITLFSARNYTNVRNAGAVMRVGPNLKCRFIVFRMSKAQKAARKRSIKKRSTTHESKQMDSQPLM